jgi:hypothetical protein
MSYQDLQQLSLLPLMCLADKAELIFACAARHPQESFSSKGSWSTFAPGRDGRGQNVEV